MKIHLYRAFILMALTAVAISAHAGHRTFSRQEVALMEPVPSVLGTYFKIATALARDSMDGVAPNASAIGSAIHRDRRKMLSTEIAAEADALAQTKDLRHARTVFRELSNSLIRYLADRDVSGAYQQFYCPIAKTNWLQKKGTEIDNPYLGRRSRGCGTLKN